MTDDLSPEQQIARALVAMLYGDETADQVVRDDRVASYLVGALLAPVLTDLADQIAAVAARWQTLPAEPPIGDA